MMRRMLCLAALLLVSAGAARAADDPAGVRVADFCHGLLDAARSAKAGGVAQRATRLEPLVAEAFNVPVMAQLAVGEPWGRMTAPERASVIQALTRYSAARYAVELDDVGGERCIVDPQVETRGLDKLVRTKMTDPDGTTAVNYRLRAYGGAWKAIDVYYNGVSQLTTQRADFAGVIQQQGAAGLVARLKELTAKMR